MLLPDFLFHRFAENDADDAAGETDDDAAGETDDDAAKRAIVDFCTRHGMASKVRDVDALVANAARMGVGPAKLLAAIKKQHAARGGGVEVRDV